MDDDENDFSEPEEGDYTSPDHVRWYQYGRLVLITSIETCEQEVLSHMNKERFWPNAWFISDHGNAHLLSLEGAKS